MQDYHRPKRESFRFPETSIPPIVFPPVPLAALSNASAAQAWRDRATEGGDEIVYPLRPGIPVRPHHDAQVLALAKAARPMAKHALKSAKDCGRIPHVTTGQYISAGATVTLARLVELLPQDQCKDGLYVLAVTNATLAHETGWSRRTVIRHLAQLHDAGVIYRHYTTGARGLDRVAIDLGPLATRAPTLTDAMLARADERREERAELRRCSTVPTLTRGGDNPATLNTAQDQNIDSASVAALERKELSTGCGQSQSRELAKRIAKTQGAWLPTPAAVAAACPALSAYVVGPTTRRALLDAGYLLASSWGLCGPAWGDLVQGLGRDWAPITIGVIGELPAATFTHSTATTTEGKRAAYAAGVVRKLRGGEDVHAPASWFRHVRSEIRRSEGSHDPRSVNARQRPVLPSSPRR